MQVVIVTMQVVLVICKVTGDAGGGYDLAGCSFEDAGSVLIIQVVVVTMQVVVIRMHAGVVRVQVVAVAMQVVVMKIHVGVVRVPVVAVAMQVVCSYEDAGDSCAHVGFSS